MKNPTDKEGILYAFAIEANPDRSTLERYLRDYPELAEDLIDLSSELFLDKELARLPTIKVADPGCEDAWKEFLGSALQRAPAAEVVDPFARFRGAAFVALAKALDVPRSILTALRDGLVAPSSIPESFMRRFAAATDTAVDSVSAYLAHARQAPPRLAFKSDEKPSPQGQTTFRQLVQSSEMTDGQRLLLLKECDEDELP
jgi:hypothetical protein